MSETIAAPAAPSTNGTAEGSANPEGSNGQAAQVQPAKTWKLNVYGQEKELNETELLKRAQMAEAAEKRFEEASKKEKEVSSFLKALENDFFGVAKAMGKDPRQLAEAYLRDIYKVEQMPEGDRKAYELEQRLKSEQFEKQKLQEQFENQRREQAMSQIDQNLNGMIVDALEKSTLPKNERTVSRMAYYMEHALRNDILYQMGDIVERVKQDYGTDTNVYLESLSDEDLTKLPKSVIDKILKTTLKKPSVPRTVPTRGKPQPGKKANPMDRVSDLARRVGLA